MVNDELTRMWREAVMAYFKELSQHLLWKIEENHEKPVWNSHSPGWELNPGSPFYEAGELTYQSFYLLFVTAPATFSESMFGPKNIKDAGDSQYTQGNLEYAPRYPVFNFENK